jgi:ABC-2 type transport system permease protein
LHNAFATNAYGTILSDPHLWLGVVAGAAMIAGAVWLRRYRDET